MDLIKKIYKVDWKTSIVVVPMDKRGWNKVEV